MLQSDQLFKFTKFSVNKQAYNLRGCRKTSQFKPFRS